MATKQVDIHRTALALIQANKAGDVKAVTAVLSMVEEDEVEAFLAALANMVYYALACDPDKGWDAFVERYAASLDEVEAKLQGKNDT
jgi:hypothetical protein